MKKSMKIFIAISIIVIIGLGIGLYFIMNNKSSSNQATINPNDPNTLGFCTSPTTDGIDQALEFRPDMVTTESELGLVSNTGIQYKWAYDPTNVLNTSKLITNKSNVYSSTELSALGKTDKPNTYLVNKVIAIYDKNDPKYKTGTYILNPYIMTTLSKCM